MSTKLLKGLVAATALGMAVQASALDLGYEVTIWDGKGADAEDGEVEPGMQYKDEWDLEGFFFDDEEDTLSMVGGFDFVNGFGGEVSGDIFLSEGTPIYGNALGEDGHQVVDNKYGYNYVLDMDYENGTYEIFALDGSAQVMTANIKWNEGSSPFQYVSGGESTGITGDFSLQVASSEETGFDGESHYVLGVGLADLMKNVANGTVFYSHFTMSCGNDNLMGSWEVPEPTTFALLSFGLAGLMFSRRKQAAAKLSV